MRTWRFVEMMCVTALFLSGAPMWAAQTEDKMMHTPFGSRIPRWEETPTLQGIEASKVLRAFAACVIAKRQEQDAQLLKTFPDSRDEARAIKTILGSSSSCLRAVSQMRLKAPLFRGAIAESLYRVEFPIQETLSKRPMRIDYSSFMRKLKDADSSGVDAEDAGIHTVWWMSYCTVHEDPAGADGLLRTEPGTQNELDAFRALRPVLAGCLFNNQTADFNRTGLRGFIADALYRMRSQIDGGS